MGEQWERELGARLRLIRFMEGFPRSEDWADHAHFERPTWSNYEAGRRVIAPKEAIRVCELTGVTMDWIYRGQEHSLPGNVRERLRATAEGMPSPRRSPRLKVE